ncbi:SIMPL domain-containing protein [Streptomyces sp. NPDC026672]|uniref:SIMPL domain-containing protein n=1 Tax=unclassified Streptomyces TaxID=2593676 RepID=UPI0033C3BDCC
MTSDSPAQAPAEPPRVSVRGEAHLDVDPELARLHVTVGSRGRDRRAALDDLTRRNAAALDLVKSYGEAVERLETGFLSITPELSAHGRGERVRTYTGQVRLTADLRDFTVLGELTTRLADMELTRVDGPWWSLRPGSPVHRRARQEAVRDAVLRAREYAEALGAALADLIELADIGAEEGGPQFRAAGRTRSRSFSADAQDMAAPIDLEPQRQQVHAQVTARFTITRPIL